MYIIVYNLKKIIYKNFIFLKYMIIDYYKNNKFYYLFLYNINFYTNDMLKNLEDITIWIEIETLFLWKN